MIDPRDLPDPPMQQGSELTDGFALIAWRLTKIEVAIADAARSHLTVEIDTLHRKDIAEEFARVRELIGVEQTARVALEQTAIHQRDAIAMNRKRLFVSVASGIILLVASILLGPAAKLLGLP